MRGRIGRHGGKENLPYNGGDAKGKGGGENRKKKKKLSEISEKISLKKMEN